MDPQDRGLHARELQKSTPHRTDGYARGTLHPAREGAGFPGTGVEKYPQGDPAPENVELFRVSKSFLQRGDDSCRVAPAGCPAEALTRSGLGDFHHPAPPLTWLAEI